MYWWLVLVNAAIWAEAAYLYTLPEPPGPFFIP